MGIYRGSESTGTATQVFNIDGDKGDITVTNGGDTWTIDSGVVNTSKLGGDITAQGKALLDDATASQQRTTLGLGSAATQDISIFATAAQGAKADTALQPTAIGTTVQAYNTNLDSWALLPTSDKQDTLVSGTNIKTVNGSSLLGSGNLSISVTDGDKGDITVSSSGSSWTIDNGAVSTSKLGGDITTAGKALLDDIDAAAQRTTLGLGTAATTNSTDYATAAQGTKADTAVQPADIANMLETSDIGVTVQGYDADTAKYDDTTANFTGTLQNGGSNVLVDSDIGSTVLAYDSNLQGFVNTFTLPTIDSTNGYVLTTNGSGTISWQPSGAGSMVYPGAGIAVSTGSAWGTSITDNSTNWNTAYSWGDHATAGYLDSGDIGVSVQGYNVNLTTWAGKTAPIGDVVGTSDNQTLTTKTINLSSNTLTGTKSQFNTACSDGDFVYTDAIGVSVQAYDAQLADIAALTPTDNTFIVGNGTNFVSEDAATARTSLGLGTLATQNGTFSGTSSGTNTGDQNIFQTIAVSGQSNVVADSTSDTLTLVAGTGIAITTNASTDSITIQQNQGICRAWVNFNGTLAAGSMIRSSFNVSSMTDDGAGLYRVNFSTSMTDENYATLVTASNASDTSERTVLTTLRPAIYSTSQVGILIYNGTANFDRSIVCVSVFR